MKNFKNKPLKILIFCLILISTQLQAQVGIGTTTPDASAAIDVTSTNSGALFPRMTTTQRNNITNPATGLLVFNTATNTFDYNAGTSGTPNWISLSTGNSETRATKYFNDISTANPDLAVAATIVSVPLFITQDFNDDTALYNVVSNTNIQVNEAGRYRITSNIYVQLPGFGNLSARVYINNTSNPIGDVATIHSSGIIFGGVANNSSFNFSVVADLNANDQIFIGVSEETGTGTTNMISSGSSSILIEKIN